MPVVRFNFSEIFSFNFHVDANTIPSFLSFSLYRSFQERALKSLKNIRTNDFYLKKYIIIIILY